MLEDLYASFVAVIHDAFITLNTEVAAATDAGRKAHQAALHEDLYQAIVARDGDAAQAAVNALLGDIIESLAL